MVSKILTVIFALSLLGVSTRGADALTETDPLLHADGGKWGFVKATVTDPSLPRVLLIGDSILIGYGTGTIKALDGKANVDAWLNPLFQSEKLNRELAKILENGPYDVVHFNVGLHGWQEGRILPGTYEPLTRAYVQVIRDKMPQAKLIWANTTPMTIKGKPTELDAVKNGIILDHNRMAATVMAEMDVPINDFYGLLINKLELGRGDTVHWKPAASRILARAAADSISRELAVATSSAPANTGSAARPNILFILVDDQSPLDLKVYDPKSALQTPTLDRLAAEGMVFDQARHMGSFSGAVCTPSRHMIMSGRTVWHLPIGPDDGKHCPPDLQTNTLAAVFNRAGYATMRTCKNGNSYNAANKQFTVRRDATKRGGTDESGSAWHAEQVLNYLKDREESGDTKPFMIYYGFSHPHDVRDGKPELLARYGAVNHKDPKTLPPANPKQPALPVNYLPGHPFPHGHPNLRDEVKVSGVWTNRDERTIRNELGREFACSENIDIQIDRVLDQLEAMGELDNTYVFYTADHGMAIGRHGLQGKQNLYEHTWRVPFIVKGPGIQPGSRVPGNIYLLDVLATVCDLTGIEPPSSNEGLSFRPVLEGKQQVMREVLYGVYSGGTKPGMRCVKQGDWKLIKYDVLDGQVRETQLFNLAENPDEFLTQHQDPKVTALTGITPTKDQVNLAGDPRYADKLEEMEALLLSEMRRHDDPYRLWNQPDDGL